MDTEKLIERLRNDTVPSASGGNLPKAQAVMTIERREAADALEASTRRVKELRDVLDEAFDFLGGVDGAVEIRNRILTTLSQEGL